MSQLRIYGTGCFKLFERLQAQNGIKILEASYLNLAEKYEDPKQHSYLNKITDKYDELSKIRHKNCIDYFGIWLKIVNPLNGMEEEKLKVAI